MRLLNPDFCNPYTEESPFHETFERLLQKVRKIPDSLLDNQMKKQQSIFDDPKSDGLAQYNAEEITYAIIIVKGERNPEYLEQYRPELDIGEILDSILPEIPSHNTYDKNSEMGKLFDKDVSNLTLEDSDDLKLSLAKLVEEYEGNELSPTEQMQLIWKIQTTKVAIKTIG